MTLLMVDSTTRIGEHPPETEGMSSDKPILPGRQYVQGANLSSLG